MVKERTCDCNDIHHTGHDYIHYKHVNACIDSSNSNMPEIGEK